MRKSIVAVALVAALALGGCSAQTGAAAVVDGEPIATATLDRTTRELGQFFAVDARGLLPLFVLAPLYLEEAAAVGVATSRDEALGYLEQVNASRPDNQVDVSTFSDETLDLLRAVLVMDSLAAHEQGMEISQRVTEHVGRLDVEVNPRYGQFDPATGSIAAWTPEWIAQPGTA